jgi:hypothetical protein
MSWLIQNTPFMGTVVTVGTGKTYATISAALAANPAGDILILYYNGSESDDVYTSATRAVYVKGMVSGASVSTVNVGQWAPVNVFGFEGITFVYATGILNLGNGFFSKCISSGGQAFWNASNGDASDILINNCTILGTCIVTVGSAGYTAPNTKIVKSLCAPITDPPSQYPPVFGIIESADYVTTATPGYGASYGEDFILDVASLSIAPLNVSIEDGTTKQYSAIATLEDGSTVDVTSNVAWSSSKTGVATIDSVGLATAIAGGLTIISATIGSLPESTDLTVIFTQIKVLPSTKYLTPGEAWQYSAIIGSEDVTGLATWSSSDPSVAAVSSSGLVKTFKLGRVAITATLDGVTGGAILIVVPNITTGIPNIVSFANRYGVYRSAALQSKRYKYPKQTFSVIKVIATTYPVTIDIIYPLLKRGPKTISAKVSSSDPQRIKPLLADCCEVRAYNSNAVISAIYLATSYQEIPL